MSTFKIVIEIDWKTALMVVGGVIACMAAYHHFFYEEDKDDPGKGDPGTGP